MVAAWLCNGAALVWWPLRHWLGHLARIQTLGAQLQQGDSNIQPVSSGEAPLEFPDHGILHFTLGGPWFENWPGAKHDDLWLEAAK